MSETIRVLVCDDDLFARRAIIEFIGTDPGLELVGDVADGESALAVVAQTPVDVVLMDIGMPGISGVEAALAIRSEHPRTRVLMLTALDDADRVRDALAGGASGFLLKDLAPSTLTDAVRSAHRGLRVLSPGPLQHVLGLSESPAGPVPELTERERAVLDLLCHGASNQDIGAELFLSRSSVKAAVSSLMSKLGANSRLHAVSRAHELKLDR